MAVQAKEPISEAKSRAPSGNAFYGLRRTAVPFVASDVDVVLKSLIQFLVPIFKQSIKSAPGFPLCFPS